MRRERGLFGRDRPVRGAEVRFPEIVDAEAERALGAGAGYGKRGGGQAGRGNRQHDECWPQPPGLELDQHRQHREGGERGNCPQRTVDQQHLDQGEELGEHQELDQRRAPGEQRRGAW